MIEKIVGVVIGAVTVGLLIVVLLTIPMWLLWNWLMPTIFSVTKITLLQALGLNILSSMLFKTNVRRTKNGTPK